MVYGSFNYCAFPHLVQNFDWLGIFAPQALQFFVLEFIISWPPESRFMVMSTGVKVGSGCWDSGNIYWSESLELPSPPTNPPIPKLPPPVEGPYEAKPADGLLTDEPFAIVDFNSNMTLATKKLRADDATRYSAIFLLNSLSFPFPFL
jgi:hypothetical protein